MPDAQAPEPSRISRLRDYWRPAAVLDRNGRWLKLRLENLDLFDEHASQEDIRRNPLLLAGGGAYFYLVLVWVSGFLLILYYIPTATEAWDSINRIQQEVPLGWLYRGVHKYGADAFIILVTVRIYRMLFRGEYKRPGELSWAVAILLLLFGMYSGLTGYLLIWNQRALWATKVFATFPTYLDDIPYLGLTRSGVLTAQLLLGGSGIGPATITRFYMLHYTFSLVLILLTELHFYKRRYPAQGQGTLWLKVSRMNLPWPAMVTYALMLVVVSAMLPATMGGRADAEVTPVPVLSDWYFLALYQMFKEMKPVPAVIGTMAIPLVAILIPWFDTSRERAASKRPLYVVIGVMSLIYWIVFSWLIIADYVNILKDPYIWYMSMFVAVLVGYVWQYPPKRTARPFWGVAALLFWVAVAGLAYVSCVEGMLRAEIVQAEALGWLGSFVVPLNEFIGNTGVWFERMVYFGPWPQDIVGVRVVYNLAVLIPSLPFIIGVFWHFRALPYSAWVGTAVATTIYLFVFTIVILLTTEIKAQEISPGVFTTEIPLATMIARNLSLLWPGWALTMAVGGGAGWLVGLRRARAAAPARSAQPQADAVGAPAP